MKGSQMRRCISRYFISYGLITTGTIIVLFLQLQRAEHSANHPSDVEVEISETTRAVAAAAVPEVSERPEEEIFVSELRERREVMRAACQREGLDRAGEGDLLRINPWEYLINKRYNIVWCNVFKSASSSWMYIFNLLAGYSKEFLDKSRAVPLQLAREKYPRPSVDELSRALSRKNVTSIIIGRSGTARTSVRENNLESISEIPWRGWSPPTETRSMVLCPGLFMINSEEESPKTSEEFPFLKLGSFQRSSYQHFENLSSI